MNPSQREPIPRSHRSGRIKALCLLCCITTSADAGDFADWTTTAQAGEGDAGDDEPDTAPRKRARDLGITIGVLPPGPLNAITDVPGVTVGHTSIAEGAAIRTGVTIIKPHAGNLFRDKVPAAISVGNGFGKFVGLSQVAELGELETPIGLTNTLSTFTVARALIQDTLRQPGNEEVRSVNPVVGECNDGFLNDIRRLAVNEEHVNSALAAARSGAVTEGAVGAGLGMRCMGWKGGVGTASRKLPAPLADFRIGVLTLTNFNGILDVNGAPVGRELHRYYLQKAHQATTADSPANSQSTPELGSCIVIIATNAPLDARQLQRVAKRSFLGLAAVGSPMTHGSGEYALAFSNHPEVRRRYHSAAAVEKRIRVRDDALSPVFQAVKEATTEAVLNSLFTATTTTGRDGHIVEAIPISRVLEICRRHRVLTSPPEK